ncbi:MAG: hypothetical protein V3W18_07730 [candidate division Zixibacteria bacterium]
MAGGIWLKLANLDRRWIYFVIGVVTFIPILFYIEVEVNITPEVESVYHRVDSLAPGTVIMVPMEFSPSTMAELEPMARAVLRHCFSRDLRVLSTALQIDGIILIEKVLRESAVEYGKKYGEDYVFLGYKPDAQSVILSMGENFRNSFPRDYYGDYLDDLPMMNGISNYSNMACIVNINATSGVDYWINYANGRYGAELALGVTAVIATDYYTFLQSNQIFGLMGGLKGAAEYERLIGRPKDIANRSMTSVSVAHVFIILFIIIGNVAYFVNRRKGQG